MPLPIAPLLGLAAAGVAGGVAALWRQRHCRRVERAWRERFTLGNDGIVAGAEGFTLERAGAPAVLLLHGFGDTPASLRYLGTALHAAGYAVHAPLLPGHGRAIRAFQEVRADRWLTAARDALRVLCARHEWVAVAGLSMGGALAVRLATDEELGSRVHALVLLAPYLVPPAPVRVAAFCSRGWGALVPYVSTQDPRSIQDQAERGRALGYGVATPAALRALVATAQGAFDVLPQVRCPTLMVVSRHDHRVAAAAAERAFAQLGARERRLVWRDVGGHILPVDHGRDAVFTATLEWLAAHGPAGRPRAGGA